MLSVTAREQPAKMQVRSRFASVARRTPENAKTIPLMNEYWSKNSVFPIVEAGATSDSTSKDSVLPGFEAGAMSAPAMATTSAE